MTPQLVQFYTNWLGKADGYEGENLANHFNRFRSLYVVYNSLYVYVMNELVISGAHIPQDFKEKKQQVITWHNISKENFLWIIYSMIKSV